MRSWLSRPWKGVLAGAQLDAGRDVFGGNFARLAAFVRYDENRGLGPDVGDSFDGSGESREKAGEIFIDAGVNYNQMSTDLTSPSTRTKGARELDDHFAVGARRFVSQHSDLGTRIETDGIQGHNLVGVRLLDYRYRFEGPMAASVFLGAARYNLATPAYGFYYGAGVQWRNLFPGWDLGADIRYADSVARDHLLPSDPHSTRPDSFYNITSLTLSISRHF